MPPLKRVPCQICINTESKYTCGQCRVVYCSTACYQTHKGSSCQQSQQDNKEFGEDSSNVRRHRSQMQTPGVGPPLDHDIITLEHTQNEPTFSAPVQLRPLTSLKWPYVPEESAYPDPLKRDDPKALQLHQYEAIATSPSIRHTLAAHPQLPGLLRRLDDFRGPAREEAFERALGVSPDIYGGSSVQPAENEDDQKALRELAEAVEAAVRGDREGLLGLDWGD